MEKFSIYWKYFVEIELNKSQMTLMIGVNGSGKSTMLDVINFCVIQ